MKVSERTIASRALDQGGGIVRLAPNWVPRSFCVPGRRLKLHPDDYYAMGGDRGGIDERWFASATPADNGPLTSPDEGLSFIVLEDGGRTSKVRFADAVAELKGELIGERLWKDHGRWPMYSKFFDIMMQGHGTLGNWEIETPALIRYGQLTRDEYFVSEKTAKAGVTVTNPSQSDPIVMLKHFGPDNPELAL